jgi:selenide, water dikinase
VLDAVLSRLPRPTDPNVLVGYDTSDDAGVYLVAPELAIVQTVDFFTPIVDDPFLFGAIAAVNSLSDVYAMGGRPISALSIVAFPQNGDPKVLEQIVLGGLSKMNEAKCTVIGGHSIRDDELKFGYAVTGVIHPQRVWRNVGAQPGDALIFTKALGTGLISTALKNGKATEEALAASTASMTRLNKDAAEALLAMDGGAAVIHAVTDITGFGLLGHAKEMAAGSKVSFELDSAKIPALPGALDAARAGQLAGGLKNNREWLEGCVEFAASVPEEVRCLLFDPQTSGGLLVSIAAAHAEKALAAMAAKKVPAQIIGNVLSKRTPLLSVK